uniref:Uncharacterized protein n=1 Tax=Talaromyces marneffei PM1 TaxID=1077442 RepID=A0A093V8R2_TALMA
MYVTCLYEYRLHRPNAKVSGSLGGGMADEIRIYIRVLYNRPSTNVRKMTGGLPEAEGGACGLRGWDVKTTLHVWSND